MEPQEFILIDRVKHALDAVVRLRFLVRHSTFFHYSPRADIIGVCDRNDAVKSAAAARAAAMMLIDDPVIASYRPQIVSLVSEAALPLFSIYSEYTDEGGLMAYGPSLQAIYWRGATYVDRILRGAKPSDLPVEQPTVFELVVNLTTAKALGLELPPTLLARANRVIE